MASVSSVELNYLVFRYLQESGFTHSAFALGYEANINKSPIDGNLVPPGALITFVQKGFQYLEMEANLSNSETDVDEDFSFLQPMDLISKDVYELRRMVREKKRKLRKDGGKEPEKENERERKRGRDKGRKERGRDHNKDRDRKGKDEKVKIGDGSSEKREIVAAKVKIGDGCGQKQDGAAKLKIVDVGREKQEFASEKVKSGDVSSEKQELVPPKVKTGYISTEKQEVLAIKVKASDACAPKEITSDREDKPSAKNEESKVSTEPEPMDITMKAPSLDPEISNSDVTILEGHTSEVCACAWSPLGTFLASGSGDSTARIWKIADNGSPSHTESSNALVLKHVTSRTNENSKDVTTLDWNYEGSLLATGSYDGQARIWSTTGELKSTLSKHKGPIFSLKWNKKGDYLLTGSCDMTAIVWDVKAEEWKQQFQFHSGPTLDVDWRNNNSFATSSTDNMIYVCKIGESRPIKTFSGHQGEVNCVKWDPTGLLLASCSDDVTAKIWSMKQDNYIHDLKEHTKEIYTIRWSPTGPGTNNPNRQLVLASASFDSTIKIWDVELGKLLCSLNGHREPVYSVAFSPSGEYLVSGSLDKSLHIWSLKEGKIIKTYTGQGGIFEVCWNKEGDKIAACFANNTVCVLDFRM